MKILQLIQKPQLRGAEIFACQLSNHLEKQGHEVLVVTIYKGDSELPFNGRIKHLNRKLSNRFFDIGGWKKLENIINEFNADVIQANASDTLKFAASSKLMFSWKQPLIYRNANKMGDFINSKFKHKVNRFYLSQIDYVISVSKECEKDFISTFDYPEERIRTVEIGVEEKSIGEMPKDLKVICSKGKVLTHIGGFVPEKNHSGLFRIFEKVLKEFPDSQLILLGEGELKEKYQSLSVELQLNNQIHFLGYRSDVLEILKHSDIFILPSLIEGLPGVILEAMYCATPVVAYNVGGVGEVVVPDQTGYLIQKGDEEEFVKAIKEIFRDNTFSKKMVDNAFTMIKERFLNSEMSGRFLQVYKMV